MKIRRNGIEVVKGHLLENTTDNNIYEVINKSRFGREIRDDNNKNLLISNNCMRNYFILSEK